MSQEKKEYLTPAQTEKLVNMDYNEQRNWRPDSEAAKKIRNTIEKLEEDLKSIRGLKRFIEMGVLVNQQLIVAASPDKWRSNIELRALGESERQIRVSLSIQQAKRLRHLLQGAIKAARAKRSLMKLKELYKEKIKGRRYY